MNVRLRKLGKGGYYFAVIRYKVTDGSGRTKRKETSVPLETTSKTEAMVAFGKVVKDVKAGRVALPGATSSKRLSLAEATEQFLTSKSHLRSKTQRAYRIALKGLKKHAPPGLMCAHLNASHVRKAVEAPKETTLKDGTVKVEPVKLATKRHRRRHLGVFCRWAVERGYLGKNPIGEVKLPKAGKSKPAFLNPKELERILIAIDSHVEMKRAGGHIRDGEVLWLKDLILVTVGTGMRLGEVCALRWRDVDFESGFIAIRNTEDFTTKSGDERWIPLVGDALDVLRRRNEARTDDLDGPALTYGDGRPIVPSYASKRFKKFVRLAKLDERFKFHSLRHTTASWLTMKGVSPAIIQQILGHADISTTMIYAHLAPETMKRAMQTAFGEGET